MGACSGKGLEKEYAGYSPTTRLKVAPKIRTKGSVTTRRGSSIRKGKQKVGLHAKNVRHRIENRHGFNIDPNMLQVQKSKEVNVLLKLMNHESKETSTYAYEIIRGLSINEFTGAIAVTPQAVKNLATLMSSHHDEVLVGCITVLHSLVQQDEDLTTQIYIACVDRLTSILRRDAADLLCGAISLLGLMAAVDDILCDMIDKDLHEVLADRFHATNDVVVKRQIFLALHNFMLIKNSEKAMHTKVIKILIDTLQMQDEVIDPDIRISALRILSYISMSGSEYLQKMIGELGGIPTLARLARVSDRRNNMAKESSKTAGMALSCLCCVLSLQEQVLAEWGLDTMLYFLDVNSNDYGASLAVIMAINNLLTHSPAKQLLRDNTYLKHLLRTIQQKTNNEDIQEECTEALSLLLPSNLKQSQQTKFERLCMQYFSPFVPAMRRKSRVSRGLPSVLVRGPKEPPTSNWLLSPDHSTLAPRRLLFPRKLNLFSPTHLSPPLVSIPDPRRHSVSVDSILYSVTSPPPRAPPRRKSIPSYSATPRIRHRHKRRIQVSPHDNSTPIHSSQTIKSSTNPPRSHSPLRNTTIIKHPHTSLLSIGKLRATSPPVLTSSSSNSSFIFRSPFQSPAWTLPSPLPPRPNHPSPSRFSSRYPSQQSPTYQSSGPKT